MIGQSEGKLTDYKFFSGRVSDDERNISCRTLQALKKKKTAISIE
jgi:hypothetical protein